MTTAIDGALTALNDSIDARINMETAYVIGIKYALVEIIHNMRECVEHVIENRTTMTPE
jgi:hypothetical protein